MAPLGKRYSRAEKEEILRKYTESKLSLSKFCKAINGPNPNSVRAWALQRSMASNKFVAVKVQTAEVLSASLSLKLGRVSLEFKPDSVSLSWVADLMKVLQ